MCQVVEAQAFLTPTEYVRPLLGKPLDEYPLQRLGRRVEAAARADLRRQSHESIEEASARRAARPSSSFELVHEINLESFGAVALETRQTPTP
jgi:hypothetical protein